MSVTAPPVPVIAVDGPAASGKGTVAAGVAQALGFHLLDSGSLYRLVALKALDASIPVDAEFPLVQVAAGLDGGAGERLLDCRVIVSDFERTKVELADVRGCERVLAAAFAAFEGLHEAGGVMTHR